MTRARRLAILLIAGVIVLVGARDYAGGWNDASHLAAAESLIDRGTFVIDDSIFVTPPASRSPYAPDDVLSALGGTRDRIFVNGHYYSDKPPVVSLILAALYGTLQWTTGLIAASDPQRFCRRMTIGSSGLSYLVALWSMSGIGAILKLSPKSQTALTLSFAGGTVALAYSRAVNQHVLLLAVAALVFRLLASANDGSQRANGRWLAAGALAGLGYTLDLGAGPWLLASVVGAAIWRTQRASTVVLLLAAAAPFVGLHHVVTWSIGGTLMPLNSVPEYLRWPGSPFGPDNATGMLHHTRWSFVLYALDLLFGKHGFLLHNLPLLMLAALPSVWQRAHAERPEVAAAVTWIVATWLTYSLLSNNASGGAVSVRWFVPLLVPAYYLLALQLREWDTKRSEFVWLSVVGSLLAVLAWRQGPWTLRMLPLYWPIALVGVMGWVARRRRRGAVPVADQSQW